MNFRGRLWYITDSGNFIGEQHRNRWWENLIMPFLFALAVYGALKSVQSVIDSISDMV